MKGAALWQDPGEAGGTGPVAPVAPRGSPGFVLASVSTLDSPHLCRSALVFPPVSRCSHGLACPPGTRKCLFAIARSPCVARVTGGLRTGVAFTFDPRQVRGNAKQSSIFLIFPLRSRVEVALSAFTDCLRQRSDSGLWWLPSHDDCRSCCFFLTSALFSSEKLVRDNPLISKLLHFLSL